MVANGSFVESVAKSRAPVAEDYLFAAVFVVWVLFAVVVSLDARENILLLSIFIF